MTFTPKVIPMNVVQQGAEAFIWVSQWNDCVQASSAGAVSYDLAAARTAMGLTSKEALFAVFTATGPFYCDFHKTAVLPSGNTTDGSSAELSPTQRYIDQTITTLSFIAPSSVNIIIAFYRP